ncbi:MAG: hypothetical protein ACUBOA_12525 [Candidatus Loosdrechtia sp.]|uniref:hypothetical protein n=1 Tax=Candidatus Loosdrechtia sp. TaxID=3101272 RepID=UPI003A6952D6|nr:MAG: hypothetical protein QY305_14695 [Candidatus Jettenia sp. AMX2]
MSRFEGDWWHGGNCPHIGLADSGISFSVTSPSPGRCPYRALRVRLGGAGNNNW